MAEVDCGITTFGVHRGAWADPKLAGMVAPPVIVSSVPVRRSTPSTPVLPVGKHRHPAR